MSDRLNLPDSLDEAFAELCERGWTDGLPVIPPTPERVERMLTAVQGEPSSVIAEVPPMLGEASLEKIAANAVMAGCLPVYMPVIVAAVRAMCRPEFNLAGIQVTGDAVTPGLILNGSIRTRLDLNCGENAAGPGRRANATIGRAIRLILTNIGGGVPGVIDRAMLGQPAKYTFCLGENEENSPWEPFHVERSFAATTSTVTLVPVFHIQFIHPLGLPAEAILHNVCDGMTVLGHSNHFFGPRPVTVVIPPPQAALLEKHGFTKKHVQDFLFEHARIPMSRFPRKKDTYYWHSYDDDVTVVNGKALLVADPADILIFVVGGHDYASVLYLGGWDARPVIEPI